MKKIYFLLCALLCTMAASAADYYLVGSFNGWNTSDANYKFTDNNDGTYTLELSGTFSAEFKICNGRWDDANTFGGFQNNDNSLKLGETFTCNVGGSLPNLTIAGGSALNPKFVFNPSTKELTVTGEEAQSVIT